MLIFKKMLVYPPFSFTGGDLWRDSPFKIFAWGANFDPWRYSPVKIYLWGLILTPGGTPL